MTSLPSAEFSISLEDSLAFASLSGDFNPLHVDPIAARRTQFGSTVVHGIHVALKAMDVLAASWFKPGHEPVALSATFHNPLRTGAIATVTASATAMDGRVRVFAESAGRPAFTLNLRTGLARSVALPPADRRLPRRAPRTQPYPPAIDSGEVPICLDAALLSRLLPALAAGGNTAWVADLVATTNIVGMECPGLDSIYSGFKLTRRESGAESVTSTMSFRVDRTDPRFRLARLAVQGAILAGSLDTFFRPPAVAQRSLQSVTDEIAGNLFTGQRALVIGGSRGLGEIAAKILLAGGAHVTITYARGQEDAARLQAEARALGKSCDIAVLDASRPLPGALRDELASGDYSHVYYFASPHIEKNLSGRWDATLFDRFASVYVRGFCETIAAVVGTRPKAQAAPVRVLYPSSIFLDTDEPGFAEYCAAKAAGEMAGRHMTRATPVEVRSPRLPRMRTDQTNALMDAGVEDPFPVICEQLRRYAA